MSSSDQGVQSGRYQLIPRTLIFVTRGERVLLLKGASDKALWPGRYNGVGGHMEQGEDVLSAARRELQEETGLAVPGLRLCGTITVDTGQNPGVALFVLRGDSAAGDPQPTAEGRPEWVPFDGIGNLPLVEDLYSLLPRVLAMKLEEPPFSARYRYDEQGRLEIAFSPDSAA